MSPKIWPVSSLTGDKTEETENRLEADVEKLAARRLHTLSIYKEVDGVDSESDGAGFEFLGLLIFDPTRKQTISDITSLDADRKIVTGDRLVLAKETGRRLGLGDHIYPTNALKEGPRLTSITASPTRILPMDHGYR
ncbi:unnamed protein product [Peniophora sp. CBMAI 1063]|nr:unnamed protein product [Peniophora sp. CBMAI 1063]